jgi:phosphatidylglycerophosphate synthase
VIAQAALYLATADDLEAALLPVAGRPVAFRTLVTAIRAGARQVGVPGIFRGTSVETAILTSPRARAAAVWLDADALEAGPTLLLPAAALVPPPALAALLAAAAPAVLAGSLHEAAPAVVLDAATMAAVAPGLVAGTPLGDTIGHVLEGGEATSVAPGAWYVRVRDGSRAHAAEDRLFAGLGSAIDTRLDRALHRRLSRHVTRAAIAVGLTPNQVSVASLLIGLAAAWCFWNATAVAAAVGLLIYVVAVVLDHADGEVARLTLAESRLGEWLDILVDTVVHAALVIAMGVTAQAVAGGGMALAVAGALGVIASAGVAKLWPVTSTAGGLGGALANLGSRDGFYAMLVLFIVARALAPAALPLLMIVVALGTHAYWLARALYTAWVGASGAPSDASPRTEMRGQSPRSNGGKL